MHGCVMSPRDLGGSDQSFLDAIFKDLDPMRDSDGQFGLLSGYSFLWETLKEEDISPSSSSQIVNNTAPAANFTTTDEEAISSSTKSCDDSSSSSSSSPSNSKQTDNSPPDDVRAFFGHPLNGEAVDRDANAEALLHEYNHLQVIDREDRKVNQQLPGFLDIISGKRPSPALSRTRSKVSSSPKVADPHPSDSDNNSNNNVVKQYEKELVGESNQQEEPVNLTEYVKIFLHEDFPLNLIDGQTEGQAESSDGAVVVTEKPKDPLPKRVQSTKLGQTPVLQKPEVPSSSKRAPRRSRTKTDVVSSTTNGLPHHKDGRSRAKDPSKKAVCYKTAETNVQSGNNHQFQSKDTDVISEVVANNKFSDGVASSTIPNSTVLCNGQHVITTSSNIEPAVVVSNHATEVEHPIQKLQDTTTQVLTVVVSTINNHSNNTIPSSLSNHVITTVGTPSTTSSPSPLPTGSVSSLASASPSLAITAEGSQNASLLKDNNLKKVLSEKIRSRQTAEDSLESMHAHNIQFLNEDISGMGLDSKFSPMAAIKQEVTYLECYDQQYAYGSELSNSMNSLAHCSALAMASYTNGVVSVTLPPSDDILTSGDISHGDLHEMTPSSVHHIQNDCLDNSHLHQHPRQYHQLSQQQQQCHLDIDQNEEDPTIVQSSQGQYFQVLQPLQFDSNSQVTSTDPTSNTITVAANNYFNNIYHRDNHSQLLDTDKLVVAEQYHIQPHHYDYNNGYSHFLNPDSSYSMKSPDSGYQEPCLSPSSAAVTPKEITPNICIQGAKERLKRKKTIGVEEHVEEGGDKVLMRQYSSSGSEKSTPRSTAIRKLSVNSTGYSYFLETPISTTQRRDEDRVTYLNKSQYYGLTLDFNKKDYDSAGSVVKSVILLAFREEKGMEKEKNAWEFWHGRQHSYKQRILDIDTKNCHGVLPQNIEEVAFNAVAVKWNPREGPVRVNMAVHCLSTDFSNQKGVKGIPLHIQIDTYEQSPRGIHLVHRGYCQIKAFCDKGAERKTRDEEKRRKAKGKSEEPGCTPVSAKIKGRRKTEEAFHDPCDRSEFYSMADITTPPVFFNPLHENSEYMHKPLTIGVVPSQEEEISSVPTSLELPDSCDDYYTNSPAKRSRLDSCSNSRDHPKVLLYVREHQEAVYTALMLEAPTIHGLLKSIEQKYSIAPSKVKHLYKKSRKGILVKLDDNIVRHYSHEATFIIERNPLKDSLGDYEIILIEIDDTSS